jgi:hypothetical protein
LETEPLRDKIEEGMNCIVFVINLPITGPTKQEIGFVARARRNNLSATKMLNLRFVGLQ